MTGIFIGIGGGTASGKTTLATALALNFPRDQVQVVSLDWYYRSNSHLPVEERAKVNYDHPEAFDLELISNQLRGLRERGEPVQAPSYDFAMHSRGSDTHDLKPGRTTIVEGILALHWPNIRGVFDLKIFVESDEAVRFARRLERDVRERGRTRDSVAEQWHATVKPMYDEFCAPTVQWANLVISGEAPVVESVNRVQSKLRELRLPALE